ncbi:MAG TPA: type II toxin-antitoxin system VapC family toxin [Terriglobia bacterium]|nr:type II toxin-antitoxin system VapC family toxin [Terriglobia bacterium]
MNRFVVDASVALCWCFEDQKTPYTEAVFECLAEGEQALVPAVWPLEVINALLVAERRKMINSAQFETFVADLKDLPVEVDSLGIARIYSPVLRVARRCQLTSYDAAYLELALFEGLQLATLDRNLRAAAKRSGVELFRPGRRTTAH